MLKIDVFAKHSLKITNVDNPLNQLILLTPMETLILQWTDYIKEE